MIEYRKYITRQMLRLEPEKLFVFGDNMARYGMGGQAKEMRGEPNAVGIPTKQQPSMHPLSFLRNRDYTAWLVETASAIERLYNHKGVIVWPEDGIGTGLARLQTSSPVIWAAIEKLRLDLEQ